MSRKFLITSTLLASVCVTLFVSLRQPDEIKLPPPKITTPDKKSRVPSRWEQMDSGPFFSSSLVFFTNWVSKGISVKLGGDQTAAVCFDTELLKMAVWWTGDFINLSRQRDGLGHTPKMAGTPVFSAGEFSGWAKDGAFDDPRPSSGEKKYGCLPDNWGRYRGLFVHHRQTIFSYSIGESSVLDRPGFEETNSLAIFKRTLRIDPSSKPMGLHIFHQTNSTFEVKDRLLLVRDGKSSSPTLVAKIVSKKNGLEWKTENESASVQIPPSNTPFLFEIRACAASSSNLTEAISSLNHAGPFTDLESLCQGGKANWPEVITTRGKLGNEAGPYQVDHLTLPVENPWRSWVRPTGLDFFSDGRAAVCSLSGDVWIVSGINGSLENLSWKRFASGLFQPLGLKILKDKIYVTGRDQITCLHDLNGDDEADFYENICNDVPNLLHYHEFCFDLQTDANGTFYFTKGNLSHREGVLTEGSLLRVTNRHAEVVAKGFRAPNGLAISPQGDITVTDNQGEWIPASKINWIKPDAFYGNKTLDPSRTNFAPPLCWIPSWVDNSSGGQTWVDSDKWGPFQGRLLHTSYGTCSLFLVMNEIVDGEAQGGVVKFPLKFDSGIMRARFNPADGQLYLCGLSGWQTSATREGGFYRVRYTGEPVRLPLALRVQKDAVQITFSVPLQAEEATNSQNYAVAHWNYPWSEMYDEGTKSEIKNRRAHEIACVQLSADRKTVTLALPGLKPVMQMEIRYSLLSEDEKPLKGEIYNTIHRIPE